MTAAGKFWISYALALLLIAAALTGCATEPQIVYRTVEVKIPVQVPCNAPDVPRPPFALDAAKASQGLYLKGAAALAEIKQRQAFEDRLQAALAACR